MNANKLLASILAAAAMSLTTLSAYAVQGLDAHGNQKVNNVMAKRWSEQAKGEKTPTDQKQVVNVGTTPTKNARPGRSGSNDVVVTTKEVINVCK